MNGLYLFLDLFFAVFHFFLIAFSLAGWAWRLTRRAHLLIATLILTSWFGLGIWYGIGYCPCTDWHWQVKRQLGEERLPTSYIKYYLDWLTQWDWNTQLVDAVVVTTVLTTFGISLGLSWRDLRRRN